MPCEISWEDASDLAGVFYCSTFVTLTLGVGDGSSRTREQTLELGWPCAYSATLSPCATDIVRVVHGHTFWDLTWMLSLSMFNKFNRAPTNPPCPFSFLSRAECLALQGDTLSYVRHVRFVGPFSSTALLFRATTFRKTDPQ